MQGAVLKQALNCLEGYADARIVKYEDICNSYSDKFRDLFRFSKLQWNRHIDELITAKSTGDDRINPYGTMRHSKEMPDAWKNKISSTDLDALHKYFCTFNLPFYNSPGENFPFTTNLEFLFQGFKCFK
ncbi:MAG: hypothetical protein MUF15_06345 [Acidobacteria bacterium]|nr:hypothetical protein [Acidobacteriota bacterium]